jgi:CHAT domain-containing protein
MAMGALRLFVTVILVFSLTGCASMQPKEVTYLQQSRYGEMEQYMEGQVVDYSTSPFQQLFYLCYAYSKVRRYDKLFPCLDALDRKIENGDYQLFYFDFRAAPALLRALAWTELGDYDKALAEARKGYELTKTRETYLQMRIYALTAVGLVHALRKEQDQAERFAGELQKVSTAYPNTLMAKDKYIGLAKIYMALGEYSNSLKAINEIKEAGALETFADLVSGASMSGESLFTFWELPKQYILNRSLLETGDTASAKAGYDKLLQLPQTEQNGDIFWLILFDRGRISEKEGELEEAIQYYERAIEVIEEQRSSINTEASKIGFVGDKQAVYHRLISVFYELRHYENAFEYAERAKARALVDVLATKDTFAVHKGDTSSAERTMANLEAAEYELRVQGSRVSKEQQGRRGMMVRAKSELQRSFPELASLVTVTSLTAKEVQSRVPSDEILIEYYYNGEDLFAFIIGQGGLQTLRLDGKGMALQVHNFRKALSSPDNSEYLTVSQQLYARLVAPFIGGVGEKNLLIVPHGVLHYLPFNALYSGSQYLIDSYSIRILPSASVLTFLKKAPGGEQSMLALGNPDLENPQMDLKYAQEEAIAVAGAWPRGKVLSRGKATETAVKSSGGNYRILHFATHGEFRPEAPLESSLLLARDRDNDGNLTVGELYDVKLNASLVTLSACETALGKVEMGDDVVGFTRGFLYAGANSIIASLWKVDDRATSILMQAFYESLKKTDKRAALRTAQLKVRDEYNPHPFYWAAFQLTGSIE